jgi:hypothetical protein
LCLIIKKNCDDVQGLPLYITQTKLCIAWRIQLHSTNAKLPVFFFAEIQSFLFENLLYLKRTEFAAVLKLTHEKTGGAQASTPDRGQEALHEVMVLSEAAKS